MGNSLVSLSPADSGTHQMLPRKPSHPLPLGSNGTRAAGGEGHWAACGPQMASSFALGDFSLKICPENTLLWKEGETQWSTDIPCFHLWMGLRGGERACHPPCYLPVIDCSCSAGGANFRHHHQPCHWAESIRGGLLSPHPACFCGVHESL